MLSSLLPAISHAQLHNARAEHRCQSVGQGGRRDVPPALAERHRLVVHREDRRRGVRDHRPRDRGVLRLQGRHRHRHRADGADPGALLRGHFALAHRRRGVLDAAQGDDVEGRARADRPRKAAGRAESGVFEAAEGDGGRAVWELLVGGGGVAEAREGPVGFVRGAAAAAAGWS